MMLKKLTFICSVSFVTTFSLADSIALPFLILDTLDNKFGVVGNPHYNGFALLIFALSIILGSFLAGGAIWGWGINRLMNIDVNLIRAGAITWAISVFVAGFVLYFSQLLGAEMDRLTSLDTHAIFTILFLPAIGLTVAFVTYRITGKIGFDDVRALTALYSGVGAMIGFLIMSIVLLHVFRWEVGGPFAGRRYSMISIMNVCNAAAAFLGGSIMAWMWLRSKNFKWKEPFLPVNQPGNFQETV